VAALTMTMNENQKLPNRLEGNEGKNYAQLHLMKIKTDAVHWQTLWKNPQTGELWKEFFPMPEMHGGGPPVFIKITEQEAKSEFGSW
jgi:hypothetical protein